MMDMRKCTMDENKLKKLKEVGFVMNRCCGLCSFATFSPGVGVYGECSEHTYEHKKHTGPKRDVTVHKYGYCPCFEPNYELLDRLGPWKTFTKEE